MAGHDEARFSDIRIAASMQHLSLSLASYGYSGLAVSSIAAEMQMA